MPAWSHLVFWGASIAIVVTMALALLRSVVGPTTYDRILALNSFGTNVAAGTLNQIGYRGDTTSDNKNQWALRAQMQLMF